ncbi:gluconate 2-dehydrogenase subunit 3 family protein [Hymenobacter crusticola]|uniref:Gluconate 2-dehydrogenase subunit 3 family protein n=1 Tax=Hymenobacter crusticola TaxID=1770526 RepID=A0A243W902_9BACT|nr:gluconate 2-dehydrogenase subunit 3 family protein [Hymenobacter crusticola]OUJ70203.1 hypothetical protein BXP70_24880 [Hymenobacter crusticola]
MNRRTALRNLAFVTGTAVVLPACFHEAVQEAPASISLRHLPVSASQEALLAEVCETILPKTDTPGAKDLRLHLYVLRMLDDCGKLKDQQAFLNGLKQLDNAAHQQHNLGFAACTPQQKLAMLRGLDQQKGSPTDLAHFYHTTKRLAAAGYTKSKYFMTQEVVYELVPSRYNGYFPTKKLDLARKHHGQS